MKKIVVSAIIATMVTVGTYMVALALGASEPAVAAFAIVVAATVAAFAIVAVFTAAAAFAIVAAAFVATFATVAATVAAFATVAATTVAFATLATLAVVAFAAEREGIKFRWAFAAYALEAVAIGGAFMVGSAGWSVAIALAGVIALFVLWRFAPKTNHVEQAAVA